MARGLLHGAAVTTFTGLVLVLFTTFSPMWLTLRTELQEKQCWHGEGIFVGRYWWGKDLDQAHITCKDPRGLGPMSTQDQYCSEHSPKPSKHDEKGYNKKMCSKIKSAKVTSGLSVVFSTAGFLFCVLLGGMGGRTTWKGWTLSRNQELMLTFGATMANLGAILFTVVTIGVMLSSPLFSKSHNDALSKEQAGFPFNGYSCVFQTPLHSLFSLLGSGPMECLFPGPSFACALLSLIANALGFSFLLFLLYDVKMREPLYRNAQTHPLLQSVSAALLDEEQHDDVLPASFRQVRRYSLYGAFSRRFHKNSGTARFCGLTVVPMVAMLGNAGLWLAYLMLGIQIIGSGTFSIIDDDKLLAVMESKGGIKNLRTDTMMSHPQLYLWTKAGSNSNSPFPMIATPLAPTSQIVLELRKAVFSRLGVNSTGDFLYDDDLVLKSGRSDLFYDVMNLFNFSPITSLKFFWEEGAWLIAIAVFGSVFVIPILKVVVWIWLTYAPAQEVTRGRILSFLDYIGKYSLANLYVLCFLVVALCFDSHVIVVPISRKKSILFEIRAGINAGNGAGSYAYVLTTVSSLLLGQCCLQLHQFASIWEEDRRAKNGISFGERRSSHDEISPRNGGGADSVMMDSPNFTQYDTPYMAVQSSRPASTSELLVVNHTAGNRGSIDEYMDVVPTFRSLANFGSTADLTRNSREHLSGGNRPMMSALASFGSRTALHVLAKQAEYAANQRSSHQEFPVFREAEEDEREQIDEDDDDAYIDVFASSPKRKFAERLHPHVESICDRVHSPIQGVRLKWTSRGKICIWILIFVLAGFVLSVQSWDLFRIHKAGFIGNFIVQPKDRFQQYSLISLMSSVASTGYEVPAVELSALFFLMTAIMPTATIFGLAMLWTIPLTVDQQSMLFNWLEIASAWSALDIFFVSSTAMYIELSVITSKLVAEAVPNLNKIVVTLLPLEKGILMADMYILDGFWILLVAVVLEKVASYLITEQAVTSISERRAENFLREFALQQKQLVGASPLSSALLQDAAEGLLETDAFLAFSPAGRYTSAAFPHFIYAGLPRTWWVRFGVGWGFLADADQIKKYIETGDLSSPSSSASSSAANTPATFQLQSDTMHEGSSSEAAQSVPPTLLKRSQADTAANLGSKMTTTNVFPRPAIRLGGSNSSLQESSVLSLDSNRTVHAAAAPASSSASKNARVSFVVDREEVQDDGPLSF